MVRMSDTATLELNVVEARFQRRDIHRGGGLGQGPSQDLATAQVVDGELTRLGRLQLDMERMIRGVGEQPPIQVGNVVDVVQRPQAVAKDVHTSDGVGHLHTVCAIRQSSPSHGEVAGAAVDASREEVFVQQFELIRSDATDHFAREEPCGMVDRGGSDHV